MAVVVVVVVVGVLSDSDMMAGGTHHAHTLFSFWREHEKISLTMVLYSVSMVSIVVWPMFAIVVAGGVGLSAVILLWGEIFSCERNDGQQAMESRRKQREVRLIQLQHHHDVRIIMPIGVRRQQR